MKKYFFLCLIILFSVFVFSKELTLEEAIRIALENNLQIKIEKITLNSFENNIRASKGVFDPFLSADAQISSTKSPSAWQLQGAEIYESKRRNFNLNLSQFLPTGGTLSVDWTNSRSETNSLFYYVNPSYNSGFTLSVSQPLLKNFGLQMAKKNEIKAIYNFNTNLSTFINKIESKVKEVEEAYWDLYYFYNDLKVKEEALNLAKEFLSITQKRIDVGLEAPLNIYTAQVGVATREEAIIQAKSLYELAQDRLRQLLHLEKDKWNDIITTAEEPEVEEIEVSEDSYETALNKRKEVISLKWQREMAEFSLKEAKNNLLPNLNFILSYGYSGLGGTYVIRDNSGNIIEI
ncbi:MAG: TolC family protein, partial [Thermoanaerobaculia bacterium]